MRNRLVFSEAAAILRNETMLSSINHVQHGRTSVFTHCVMVALYSERFAKFLRIRCDMHSLVRGALLHDFFLYDWHDVPRGTMHGFTHPVSAANNALHYFNVNDKEYDIIIRHMWPFTLTRIPNCREAWIVCLIDKYCSLLETLYLSPYSNSTVSGELFRSLNQPS